MNRKHGWLIALVAVVLLVAACGQAMPAPPPVEETAVEDSATTAPVGDASTETEEEPAKEPVSAGELPVDEDDWHVLGSPDAPVTIVEYSDFQ
jgi:protein-disulfide isomerase